MLDDDNQNNLVQSCGELSAAQFIQSVFAKWPIWGNGINIKYTFNINEIAEEVHLSDVDLQTNATAAISAVSESVQQTIRTSLLKWEEACDYKIRFQYQETFAPNHRTIVFARSDSLESYALTKWLRGNEYPFGFLQKTAIYLPSENVDSNLFQHVVSHEIGHALGLDHLHEVPSILKKLDQTVQGKGCSVMPYSFMITSSIANCTTEEICGSAPYAIFPGPLDAFVCQNLYKPVYTIFLNDAGYKAYHIVESSIKHGMIDTMVNGWLLNLKHAQKPLFTETMARSLAKIPSVFLLNSTLPTQQPLLTSLLLAEIATEAFHYKTFSNKIKLLRTLLTISTLAFSMYLAYEEEELLTQSCMILLSIQFNCVTAFFGQSIGAKLATATNSVIHATESWVAGGIRLTKNHCTFFSNALSAPWNWFKGTSTPPLPEAPISDLDIPVDPSSNQPCSMIP